MTTGKDASTATRYAIVCTGDHVPGPETVRGYDAACVVDALGFQNWTDRPKMRTATAAEIEATAPHLATLAANIAGAKFKRPRNTKTAASGVFDKGKPWTPLTPKEATYPLSHPVTPPRPQAPNPAAAFPMMPLLGNVGFKGTSFAAAGSTSSSSSFSSVMLTSDPCMPTPHGNHQALRALQSLVPAGQPAMGFATAAIMAQQETGRMQAELKAANDLASERMKTAGMEAMIKAAALEATILAQAEASKKVEALQKGHEEERRFKEGLEREVQARILAAALSDNRKRRRNAESEPEEESSSTDSSSSSSESDDDCDDAEELARALAKVREEFAKKRGKKTKKKSKKKSKKEKNKKGKKSKHD